MGWIPVDLMIPDVDIFRFGNGSGPKFNALRPNDAMIEVRNGIPYVLATGRGFSLLDRKGLDESSMTGHVYLLPAGTTIPGGLRLIHDKPHHYSLAPIHDMRQDQFLFLCQSLAPSLTFAMRK